MFDISFSASSSGCCKVRLLEDCTIRTDSYCIPGEMEHWHSFDYGGESDPHTLCLEVNEYMIEHENYLTRQKSGA